MPFYKPTIMISKCLLSDDDLNSKFNIIVNKLKDYVNLKPICPKNINYNEEYSGEIGINQKQVNACIYKGYSACNEFQYIDQMKKKNEVVYYIDQQDLLSDKDRDDFLTKIFCLVEFDEIKKENDYTKLIYFHNRNSYLFKLYNPQAYIMLDTLINYNHYNIFDMYEDVLKTVFDKEYSKEAFKKVALEIIDEFKDYINIKERKFLKEIIKDYEDNIVSQKMIEYLLRNNLIRFNIKNSYEQSLFERYPKDINANE